MVCSMAGWTAESMGGYSVARSGSWWVAMMADTTAPKKAVEWAEMKAVKKAGR